MTNGWVDIKNTDMMWIMGGNPAENHPCGFKWAIEAKLHRNAKMIVVDPRFTRTAAVADLFLWFWAIALSGLVFLVTGIIMWFPQSFGRIAVAVGYVPHDLAMLVMLVGFIVHIYEGTAAAPGTFRSMTHGTVSRAWAWTLHPGWYREATGRDPREDYERARQRMMERRRTE
jgi:cytochrome b subunit of formate dehydrogenase